MTTSPSKQFGASSTYPPQSLADIVGHRGAVARLRRRFRPASCNCSMSRHDTPLLLYGLPGVGKMTLARMYAKALLCDTAREDQAIPCNMCTSCTTFAESFSQNFDFYPMDAAIHRDANDVNEQLRYHPLGPRRVFLIDNFDKATPEFVDALLKPMETERSTSTPTTFVFLARDINDVRAAGQSRCAVERLDPLPDTDTRALCLSMVAASGARFASDEALQSLIIGSRGLPALIARVCAVCAPATALTSEKVREILGIDWGEPILRFWLKLTGTERPAVHLPAQFLPEKAAVYSRFVLSELLGAVRNGRTVSSGEPALRLADKALLQEVLGELRRKAELAGLPPETLIAGLAEIIQQDDFCGDTGFIEFERSIRAKLWHH